MKTSTSQRCEERKRHWAVHFKTEDRLTGNLRSLRRFFRVEYVAANRGFVPNFVLISELKTTGIHRIPSYLHEGGQGYVKGNCGEERREKIQ